MAVFVINEWLWADLSGSNGLQAQRESFSFIECFPSVEHQIVIIEGSAFDRKAWNLCRNDNPMVVQRIAGAYITSIRQNSDRCLILKPEVIVPLSAELVRTVKPDDHYLVQALMSAAGSILVTTDAPLRQIVTDVGLNSMSRDEFLTIFR